MKENLSVRQSKKAVFGTILLLLITGFLYRAVAQCDSSDLTTEYRIDGQWLSGESGISVDSGANLMLSGLPNSVPVTITTPSGTVRNDNYGFTASANNMGRYTITSDAGCSVTLDISLSNSADTQAPTAPSGLAANNISSNAIGLSWSASSDNVGVTGYRLLTNGGNPVSLGNVTNYQVSGLAPNTVYTFAISAVDAAGNVSGNSNSVTLSTAANTTSSTNLALNRPATQSSTYSSATLGRASNAVDGNTDGVRNNGSTTHTDDDEPQKWWRVDLGEAFNISEIKIFNRTDCCGSRLNGAKVYVGTADSTDPADYTDLGITLDGSDEQPFSGLTVNGRYVMVHLVSGTGSFLSLAEVEVYGGTGGGTGPVGSSPWTTGANGIDFNAAGTATGNVGIGTGAQTNYRLAVDGTIHAREVVVDNDSWPDYVFGQHYHLPSLKEVREHIDAHGHLMNVPSEAEVRANGVHLGEMNKILLEKIEELTLYMLEQDALQKQLEEELRLLESRQ
ncbi:discoidin domain-containing protein [Maribacter sp. 2-571]|uniref:galactose-binding domain-containing protein n=1 Tax=Maribacter sp. 2-571 TaxID=3417569 RepID=UPI003D352774